MFLYNEDHMTICGLFNSSTLIMKNFCVFIPLSLEIVENTNVENNVLLMLIIVGMVISEN